MGTTCDFQQLNPWALSRELSGPAPGTASRTFGVPASGTARAGVERAAVKAMAIRSLLMILESVHGLLLLGLMYVAGDAIRHST